MAGITSVGVGSGLDLESLITKLVTAERTPKLNSLAVKEAAVQANVSAFGGLKSVLDRLQSSLAGVSDASALQARTATSSDSKYFSATADGTAVAGNYNVQVLNLAKAHKLVSADFTDANALVGAGTLNITAGGSTFQVTTDATTTLAQLKDSINQATGNTGLSASLIVVAADPLNPAAGTVSKLVFSATQTGVSNAIEIAVTDADTTNTDNLGLSRFYFAAADPANSQLSEQQAALDARIAVDGFAVFSSSNSFVGAIGGLTITALKEPVDPLNPEVATLSVALDKSAVASKIQSVVNAYNDVVKTITEISGYNASTKTAGPLSGDATVRAISSRLRNALFDTVGAATNLQSLASLGVETQRDGTLKVDGTKLSKALDQNFNEVSALFASTDGIAPRLKSALDSYIGRDGILNTRSAGFDRQLKSIQDQRVALGLRLEKIEKQYRDRFSALDALVSQLQSSGDFLTAQLANTASIIGGTAGKK